MTRLRLSLALAGGLAVVAVACGSDGGSGTDGGGAGDDASAEGAVDASMGGETGGGDSGGSDGAGEASARDSGSEGSSSMDAGHDGGSTDGGAGDVVTTEAAADGASDGASTDASSSETGVDGAASEGGIDSGIAESGTVDSGVLDASDGSSGGGIITGGPCASGAAGSTAFRVKWIDGGGTAYVQYLVEGLPNRSSDHVGAYGYQIGFTPSFVDQFLAAGGVQLDSSDFIDMQMTTLGISSLSSVTLSILGRSYDVSTDGSFNWQTFDGTGQTPTDFVSNVPPYQWYSADITTEMGPGESNVLVRIKAGPSSGALVVSEIELCMVAN